MHGEAAKAMRMHGTKLFIDAPQSSAQAEEESLDNFKDDQDDFFEQSIEASASVQQSLPQSAKLAVSFCNHSTNHVLTLKITKNMRILKISHYTTLNIYSRISILS